MFELDVVIPAFSTKMAVLHGCLFCLFFSNVALFYRRYWCFPLRDFHETSLSLLELLPAFVLLLVGFYILNRGLELVKTIIFKLVSAVTFFTAILKLRV